MRRLGSELKDRGHHVETVEIPYWDDPSAAVLQLAAPRWIDLSAADRIICFRSPSYFIRHTYKIVWLTDDAIPYSGDDDLAGSIASAELRRTLCQLHAKALREARVLAAASEHSQNLIQRFYGVASELLHSPAGRPEHLPVADNGWDHALRTLLS
jgi:hypothetical protein